MKHRMKRIRKERWSDSPPELKGVGVALTLELSSVSALYSWHYSSCSSRYLLPSLPSPHLFLGPLCEVYSGSHSGAIVGVVLILAALLLIFLKSRNRNRNPNQPRAMQYNNLPQKSIFALSSYKQPPQPLPLYTQPTSVYAQHYNGGVPMPQAVHPSTSGYYRRAGQVQQDNGVRFGGVGVVRY